jgi:DNA-binding response OmpR family regulator
MTDLAAKYARLKAEAEEMCEENRQLRNMLFGDYQIPWDWGLSPSQTAILRCLIAQPEVTYDMIENAVYHDRDRPENFKNITRVQLRNLRLKLKDRNIEIHNRSGFGYFIEPETRSKLKRQIKSNTAAA